jgi:hypothetical protein
MQRSKYQSLTIKRKLEIIDLVDQAPPGKKKKDIASEAGITATSEVFGCQGPIRTDQR